MTIGQAIDQYLEDIDSVETIYVYHDQEAQPHVIVTRLDADYDYFNAISEDNNLRTDIEVKKKEVESLQAKIRGLKRDQKTLENAIRKIAKFQDKPL